MSRNELQDDEDEQLNGIFLSRLVEAARKGDYKKVTESLEKESDIFVDIFVVVGTILTLFDDAPDIIEALIDGGMDVDMRWQHNGQTLLMFAADEQKVEVLRVLLKKGANVNAQDNDGRTALDLAMMFEPTHKKTIELLKQYGANIMWLKCRRGV